MAMKRYYNVGRLLWVLLVLVVLAGCGTTPAQPPAAETRPTEDAAVEVGPTEQTESVGTTATIRLGYLPNIIYAPLFVGVERGYFAEEGLRLQLERIASGNDAVVQLAAGNFDVAMGGANAGLFNAVEQGLAFKIVAPLHSERPPVATPLVISAKRTDEIRSVADLRGKRVAVHAFGAAIEYWMAQALKQGGLTFDDVELKAVPFPEMAAALDNGAIDAAVLTEPLVTIGEDKGLLTVLADDFINGFTASYVYMNEEWLTEHPDLADRFLRAYLRGCRDLQGEYMNDEVAAIVEKYTQIPAAVVVRSTLAHFDPDGTLPLEDLAALQAFFIERGYLEYTEPLDVATFVDTEMVEAAAQELDAARQ